MIYVIVVFGFLHDVQAVLPQAYPDYNTCKAALVQTVFAFPNWGECQPRYQVQQFRRMQ